MTYDDIGTSKKFLFTTWSNLKKTNMEDQKKKIIYNSSPWRLLKYFNNEKKKKKNSFSLAIFFFLILSYFFFFLKLIGFLILLLFQISFPLVPFYMKKKKLQEFFSFYSVLILKKTILEIPFFTKNQFFLTNT